MAKFIDLRSDTVTLPGPAMRQAMAEAELGDDVYREDPMVNRLERVAAELLGKEEALFVPSGTMANQIALLCHCERGDEVIVGEGNHCVAFESGAGSAWAGVGFRVAGSGGLFDVAQMEALINPAEFHYPRTRLVALENTHNRAGGRVFPQAAVIAIAQAAREAGLAVHLDGARIWNAAVATSRSPAELAAPVDTVSACFSKGLGAPVGSVLAGSRALMLRARRFRKMLGGGMRQAGVLAAAALHALEHNRERVAEDHVNARQLAAGLSSVPGVRCDAGSVETNIVNFELPGRSAARYVAAAAEHGVRLNAAGPERLRAVTHLGVGSADIARALEGLQLACRALD